MTNLTRRAPSRNSQPRQFFGDRETELRASNPASRRIAERFAIPIFVAAAIARVNGLGSDGATR